MPQVIPLIATFAATAGTGVVASTAIFYGVQAALYLGVSIGLSFLAQALLAPKGPQPEDVQNSLKQPYQPRARHYGRVKISGPWIFAGSKGGALYKVLALGQGQLDGIEEYWVDDKNVHLDASGWTTDYFHWAGDSWVKIQTRLGLPTETAYAELTAAYPEWTSAHRGDGVATLFARQFPIEEKFFLQNFPNGINTNYRVVARGVKVTNPLTGVIEWNDHAAAIVRDYMAHADGMRLPHAIFSTPLANAGWQTAMSRCSEAIPLAGGGTEPRYRLWGSYFLNERPADVLGRMLQCCDGRLYPTADGGLALDIGQWTEPSVVLGENAIVGFSDLSRGKDILTTANTIRAQYLGIDQDYQTADADPWVDADDVAERGEIEAEFSFIMSPSHSQARRLMKLMAWRSKPRWVGTIQCNLMGLAAAGERFVRVTYPLFEIDEVFEVQNFQIIVGEGNILQGVTLELQSMPDDAYQWDPDQEQGDAPVSEDIDDGDHIVPAPEGFAVEVFTKTIGGAPVFYADLTWTAPAIGGLGTEAQGKRTADTAWITIPVSTVVGTTSAESFALADGEEYEFQIRHTSSSGRPGDWTASIIVTAA